MLGSGTLLHWTVYHTGYGRDGRGEDAVPDGAMTLRDASIRLGVSEGAIRKRVARGTLRSEMGADGRRYVWLNSTETGTDGGADASSAHEPGTLGFDHGILYEEMRERIAYLERQVEEEREARRRADTLLARLMDNLPALEAPVQAPTPFEGREDDAQDVAKAPSGPAAVSSAEGELAQNGSERSWWRRVFGG